MKRITRSFRLFHRSMQISRHPIFIFMEGKKIDPFFYGKIVSSVCCPNGITYSTHKAIELSGQGGGKQVLLSFFQYLKQKSALTEKFKGKTTVAAFFLDKDIDDVLRINLNSDHLIYTVYYDIYSHIYIEGDLTEAIAVAASLDPNSVKTQFGDCQLLRCQLAYQWKDWVKLCLFTAKKKINCRSNYRVMSQVNNPICGPLDQIAFTKHINELKSKLGLSGKKFNRAFNRISKYVDEIYSNGLHDRIFKGKWYCFLFTEHIRALNSTADCAGLENRLSSSIMPTIDFNQPWSEHYKQPLRKLISIL